MINCWLPYYHAEIFTDGSVRPCCKYNINWIESIDQYNTKDRSEFETQELSIACVACNVNADEFSYRKHRTIDFKRRNWTEPTSPSLKNLNLSLDNICSSSCVQCDPHHSTTIGYLFGNQVKYNWNLDQLDSVLPTVEHLTISGGEPLQSPRLIELCKKLKNYNIKSISVPTGLAKIKQQNIDALVELGIPVLCRVSIDAPWKLNEWIRGCDQLDWEENFKQVSNQFSIAWQITIGSYNVFALPECLDYIETLAPYKHIQPSPIITPVSHAVKQLPQELKDKIKIKLLNYKPNHNAIEIIKTSLSLLEEASSLDWNQCVSKIEKLPKLRNNNTSLLEFIEHYL
jgi:wyosine [tRNA(Phe)-imidazoG37] synthetase (radical SAM superfamily)